jgi:hypothetical protein
MFFLAHVFELVTISGRYVVGLSKIHILRHVRFLKIIHYEKVYEVRFEFHLNPLKPTGNFLYRLF